MDVWYIPVINAERLVEQTGAVTNALVNMTPLLANLSTCGVSISVSPYEEKLADISSMIIQSIFGRDESAALRGNPKSIPAARTRNLMILFVFISL